MNVGLLIVRIAFGGALALQGRAKLTRDGRAGTAAFFADMGFSPAAPLALVAGLTELGAGLMLVVGLATPLAAAGAMGVLVSATVVSWRNGYWNTAGGAEYALVSLLAAAAVAFTGAGNVSLDNTFDHAAWGNGYGVAAVIVGVGSALPLLARRACALAAGRRAAGSVTSDSLSAVA